MAGAAPRLPPAWVVPPARRADRGKCIAMTSDTRNILRVLILAGAAIGTLYWLDTTLRVIALPVARRDGLDTIGVLMATGYFLGLVLPVLVLGILGRWLVPGAIMAIAVIGLATDAIWPWLPL